MIVIINDKYGIIEDNLDEEKFVLNTCVETEVNHLIEIPALRTYTYTF